MDDELERGSADDEIEDQLDPALTERLDALDDAEAE